MIDRYDEEQPLKDCSVVVTRPAHQAQPLSTALMRYGAHVIPFPLLEIENIPEVFTQTGLLNRLAQCKYFIFISANAVSAALPALGQAGLVGPITIACVGRATKQALQARGVANPIYPKTQYNSEALLALVEFSQVKDKRMAIFKGEGGRELLTDTLRSRGAIVELVNVYRRRKANCDHSRISPLLRTGKINFIVVTSAEGLDYLWSLFPPAEQEFLCNTRLVVISERLQAHASRLGFQAPILVAEQASDQGIIQVLLDFNEANP